MLNPGDSAPDFEGKDDSGKTVTLYSLLKDKPVILYFYPKDETPGCTTEACSFRDNWDEFSKRGVNVIGVSSDTVESHRKFKEHRKLPFTLISDEGGKIRKMYQATGLLIPPRISYVIGPDRKIVFAHNSQMNPTSHVNLAIGKIKELEAGNST
jgi:peroxiredoxin Q/BCP